MKTVFVVNPVAGREDKTIYLREELAARGADFELYTTKSRGDAGRFIRTWCGEHPGERVRFIACGGDGTLNEVASAAVAFRQASIGCYPCGSGNDYVKYYGGKDAFLDLSRQLAAEERPIDLLHVNEHWAINAFHFGFDSVVAKKMDEIRRKPLIGGKNAYTSAIVYGLTRGMKNECKVTADGEALNSRDLLLCTVCCGTHVGGAYNCAPRSENDDGLAEVCLLKPLTRVTFVKLIGKYKNGTHLEDPEVQKHMVYRRAVNVEVTAPEDFVVSLDGELYHGTRFVCETVKHAINFAVPK